MARIDSDELYEQILSRLLANVPSDVDKREGSIIWNALSPVAMELQLIYEELADVISETFPDTADLDNLSRRAAERGVYWREATNAVVTAELDFSEDITSEPEVVGSVFAVENTDLMYTVTEKVSYDAEELTGVYRLTCEEPGMIGNITTGELLIEDAEDDALIDNLETATIIGIAESARDDEDLEDFRARYFDSIENEAFGGNIADYTEKALNMNMVGAVQIIPVWDGPGTVKIRFLNAEYSVPATSEVTAVQTAFDPSPQASGYGLAPIGHTVTAVGATAVNCAVVATATFETGYTWESMYDLMVAQCQAYLLSLRKEWGVNAVTVSPGVLAYLIKTNCPHVLTFACTINAQAGDFVLDTDKVPVFTSLEEAS